MEFTPRFVKAGTSNFILSSTPAFVGTVILCSKSGAASLSVYASASSTVSAVTQNRLLLSVNPASGPRVVSADVGGSLWPTGVTVSCNGAGALAIINMNDRTRGR